MTEAEQAFLAQVAIGAFSIDSSGRIWRNRIRVGGSHVGTPSYDAALAAPQRAERSMSAGYPRVMFRSLKGRQQVYAHRIVWMVTNQKDIPEGLEVNHKDGNRANHHPSNLEIVTHRENTLHSFRELGHRVKEQRGVKNTSATLDEESVLQIRSLCKNRTLSQSRVAEMFGVSQRSISDIHLRKTWRHVP